MKAHCHPTCAPSTPMPPAHAPPPPPAPCASTRKIRKTTVRRGPVLRQACACARRRVPKECTYPYLTPTTIAWKQTALGCSRKQNAGMSRRNYHQHDPAPLPSTIVAQARHVTFLTTKPRLEKTRKTTHRRGPVLGLAGAREGGGSGGGGGRWARGLGVTLFAFAGACWPLATAHSDPLWARTCFGCVNGAPG